MKHIHTEEMLLLFFYRLHSLYYTILCACVIKSTNFLDHSLYRHLPLANEYLPDNIHFIGIHKSPGLFALQKLDFIGCVCFI